MGVTIKKPAVICFYGRNSTLVKLVTGESVEIPFIATKCKISVQNNADQENNRFPFDSAIVFLFVFVTCKMRYVVFVPISENKIK